MAASTRNNPVQAIYTPVRLGGDRLCKFVRFAARGCAIWLDERSAQNAQLLITTMMFCSVTRVTS